MNGYDLSSRRRMLKRGRYCLMKFCSASSASVSLASSRYSTDSIAAIMSTGSGKSAIYQLAGLVLDGPTIVVSPLIALQEDQLDSVEGTGDRRLRGATLNSTMSETDRDLAFSGLADGSLEFVLLAPE